MSGSDPRIDALLPVLEWYRQKLGEAWRAVPDHLREAKPPKGGWSPANVLEHLVLTERAVTSLVAGFCQEAAERAEGEPFDAKAFTGSLNMPAFLDRSKKVVGSQPAGEMAAAWVWDALVESRRGLLEVMEGARGRKLEDLSRPHPTGRVLNGYQWIAFVALHEGRHAEQIREMAGLPPGS